jgi:hypothetical protein
MTRQRSGGSADPSQLACAGEDGGDEFGVGVTPAAQVGGGRPGVLPHRAQRDLQLIAVVVQQQPAHG